jgi:tight adherence protein B
VIGPVAPALFAGCGLAAALAVRDRGTAAIRARAGAAGAPARPVPLPTIRNLCGSRVTWGLAPGLAVWWWAGPVAGAIAGSVGVAGFALRRRRALTRHAATIDEGLADAVRAIAAGLRAGLSVAQAIRFAATESEGSLGDGLARVVDAAEVGEPLDEAVHRWAMEAGTDDARLVEGVLGLHRRSGGDLPRVLDRVGETLRERRAIDREVRALTAQARLSGAILGLLPIGFFAFLWLTSRRDIEGAIRTPLGLTSVAIGLVLELLAFVWIRHLLEVG